MPHRRAADHRLRKREELPELSVIFGGARRNRTDDLFNAIAEGQLIFQWVIDTFITTVYNSRRQT